MATIVGAIVLIFVITVILIIWMITRKAKKTSAYGWRHNVLYDAKTGFECELATDPTQPDDLIKYDPNTNKAFVRRERGMFEKGEDRIFLGEDIFDSKGLYNGWRMIIVNVSMFSQFNLQKAQEWRRKWLDLKGLEHVNRAQ